jgi:hypothetical protein
LAEHADYRFAVTDVEVQILSPAPSSQVMGFRVYVPPAAAAL